MKTTAPNLFILTPVFVAVGAVPMRQQRVVSYAREQPSLPKLRWKQSQLIEASYNHFRDSNLYSLNDTNRRLFIS